MQLCKNKVASHRIGCIVKAYQKWKSLSHALQSCEKTVFWVISRDISCFQSIFGVTLTTSLHVTPSTWSQPLPHFCILGQTGTNIGSFSVILCFSNMCRYWCIKNQNFQNWVSRNFKCKYNQPNRNMKKNNYLCHNASYETDYQHCMGNPCSPSNLPVLTHPQNAIKANIHLLS